MQTEIMAFGLRANTVAFAWALMPTAFARFGSPAEPGFGDQIAGRFALDGRSHQPGEKRGHGSPENHH
jgi:hypothetical protein